MTYFVPTKPVLQSRDENRRRRARRGKFVEVPGAFAAHYCPIICYAANNNRDRAARPISHNNHLE